MKCLLINIVAVGVLLTSSATAGDKKRDKQLRELVGQLKHADIKVRLRAAISIGKMGPAVKKKAIPALLEVLLNTSENFNVHNHAAVAMSKMGRDAAPALIKSVENGTAFVRRVSARALGDMGGAGVPALIKCLQDPDRNVRLIAVQSLGRIGPPARPAISALQKATSDRYESIATSAVRSLWLIQSKAKSKPSFAHGKPNRGLAAFLRCPAKQFVVGQPISVSHGIIFAGGASKPSISVRRPMPAVDPNNSSWFEIIGPDSKKLKYRGPFISWGAPRGKPTILYRHEFVGRNHPDLAGMFNLSRPGNYSIRWYYIPFGGGAWSGKLVSNEVKFKIVKLTSPRKKSPPKP